MSLTLGLMMIAMTGCQAVEGLGRDVEDGSAYFGDKIAQGGHAMSDWMDDISD